MPLLTAFYRFDGRITRRTFWTGLILLAVFSPFAFSTVVSADPFSDLVANIRQYGVKGLIWSLVLMFALAALLTKRLHDRNKTGLFALLFYGPAVLKLFTFYTGALLGEGLLSWFGWLQDWGWLIGLELGAVGIWFLIELGLYGPVEPNKYGPDPRTD